MTALHFLAIAVIGLVVLGTVRDRPLVRWLAIAATLAIAIGTSFAAVSLLQLGHRMRWTSEGPGILGVILALVVAASFAALGWSGVWRQFMRPRGGRLAFPVGLLLLVVGVVGAAASGARQMREARPSHDADVVGLAFDGAGASLYSLDASGTLKAWDAATGDSAWSRTDPALAGATAFELAPDGRHALVTTPGAVRLLDLGTDGARLVVAEVPDIRAATFVADDRIALAREARLTIVAREAAGAPPLHEHTFDAPIEAVARAGRTLAVATRDGAISWVADDGASALVRVELPAAARRLLASPEGVRLVAVSAEQRAWLLTRDGSFTEAPRWMSFGHVGFLGDDLLVAAGDRMPELLSLRLPALETSPFLNHGIGVTALAASSAGHRVAVAFGANLHLTGTLGADPRAVVAARLIDPR